MKETFAIVHSLKQLSGLTWDDERGVDINEDTKHVWEAYIEVSIVLR